MRDSENIGILCKGVIGVGMNILAVITSLQEDIEWISRMLSLWVGTAAGILTCYYLIRNRKKK